MTTQSVSSGARLTRRELDFWLTGILLARWLSGSLLELGRRVSVELDRLAHPNLFQLLAWFALFRLIGQSRESGAVRPGDIVAAGLCAISVLAPGDNAIWIACTLGSCYFILTRDGDPYRSSAATILIALATNGLWGPTLFRYVGYELLKLDTLIVATMLAVTGHLQSWYANVVTSGGSSVEIFEGCSSFHNISLALLGWVSFTKLARPRWQRSDAAVAGLCVAATLAWNSLRLYILAIVSGDKAAFVFWHSGTGARIFGAALAFTIAAVSVAGANRRTQ
jgi:exosortase/archaeosortase family protein